MASGTTHALVHYNSYWVEAKGSDEYNGTIQPILLPDEYTLEDVKTKVRGLIGFNQGPDFDIYGLLLVEATAKRQRFKINGEEPLSFYRMQATRVPSYFIVKTALCHPPITPERRQTIRSIEVESPLTPDSGGDCSKNETCNIGNTPIDSKKFPKARRCLEQPKCSPLAGTFTTPGENNSLPKTEPCSSSTPGSGSGSGSVEMPYTNELYEGKLFKDKEQLKLHLQMSKMEVGFDYQTCKTGIDILFVKCKGENCKWSLRARVLDSDTYFKITKMPSVHSCSKNKRMAKKIRRVGDGLGIFCKDKVISSAYVPSQLVADVKKAYGRTITYRQAWIGCNRGVEHSRGSSEDSYQYLVGYSHMLEKHNPGTFTRIESDDGDVFKYYFMAIGVCLEGFKTCARPAFAVDGTHLTGEHQGMLLSAVGFDGNENLFPFAFGIVDSENNDACAWFMGELYNALGEDYCTNPDLLIITDRSIPLTNAIAEKFNNACHVYCTYHIQANIVTRFGDYGAAHLFVKSAKAFTLSEHGSALDEIKTKNAKVFDYIRDLGEHRWARVKARRRRWTFMTTNMCESWNSVLKNKKGLPISHLVDHIRGYLTRKFSTARKQATEWPLKYTPHANEILEDRWLVARECRAFHVKDDEYEVCENNNHDQHQVFINAGTCTCEVSAYQYLPCPHILAVCEKFGRDADIYCAPYYESSKWRSMYEPAVFPVANRRGWDISDMTPRRLLPPSTGRPQGRPNEGRYLNAIEKRKKQGTKRACSKCRLPGHNRNSIRCQYNQSGKQSA